MTRYDGTTGWSYNGHAGSDFPVPIGTDVIATAPGKIQYAGVDPCGGNYIRIWHSKQGHSTYYFHLYDFVATSGSVAQGQLIAHSGQSGDPVNCITGPHLHFEVRNGPPPAYPIDPYGWSGSGPDPWAYDQGYLWTTNPPSLTVPYTSVSGTITQNTTWTASGSPYLVTGNLTVNSGVTLKINPGVVVKFKPGISIYVYGVLNASTTYPGGHNGTIEFPGSNSKIYFTSYKDDSVGGDTNGDGNATAPKSADYKGIYFYAGSVGIFDNAVVRYGGAGACCPWDYGVIKNFGGNVSIHNSAFKYNRDAVYGYYSYYPGVTTIDNSLITDSDNYGVYVATNYATSSAITVTNTGFGNNLGGDGYFSSRVNFTNSGNFTVGTTTRGFRFAGAGYDNQTWSPGISFYIIGSYVMNASTSLTILPGTIVKFEFGESLGIYGNLDVRGNTFNPVYFTSFRDDSVGGDTNGDGTTTAPNANDYEGIYFWQGSSGVIDNAIVRYGGDPTCCYGYYYGAIINVGGNVTVKNSVVEYNRDGIYLGLYPASLTLDNSVIRDNYNFGVSANSSFSTTSSVLAITNTLFQNNYGADAYIYGDVEFINSGNFSTGSTTGFLMYGSQSKSQAWNPGIPFVIDGGSAFGFGINASATLTVNPGSIVKFEIGSQMDVYGNLVVVGTSTNKVYFTSFKDDSIGGDTNGDGAATLPAPGDYGGIYFYASSTGYFDNAILRYGGYPGWPWIYGVIKGYGGLVNITRTKMYSNSYGTFQMGGNPIGAFNTSQSSIYGNTGYAMYSYSSSTTTAVNNWWGDPTGPYHPTLNPGGKGNQVSNNVSFIPWLTSDPN